MYILVYIKKFMSMKPNQKEINIILNILKGAQFEFLPRAPFYIDTSLGIEKESKHSSICDIRWPGQTCRVSDGAGCCNDNAPFLQTLPYL
jgi:hypothetical protein